MFEGLRILVKISLKYLVLVIIDVYVILKIHFMVTLILNQQFAFGMSEP